MEQQTSKSTTPTFDRGVNSTEIRFNDPTLLQEPRPGFRVQSSGFRVQGSEFRVAAGDIHSKRSPASQASLNEVHDQLKTPTYLYYIGSIGARSKRSQKWDSRPPNKEHQHLTGKLTARKSVLMIRPCCRSLVRVQGILDS